MIANADLMRLLQFDAGDLANNRAGLLSERQRQRLRRTRSRAALVNGGVAFVIVIAAAALLFLAQRDNSLPALLVGIMLTVANALLIGLTAQSWLRIAGDLARDEVDTLVGKVERTVRVVGRSVQYLLRVEGKDIPVTKEVFNAVAEGQRWRFYRAKVSGTLLSAESA
jgi:hypothetical protein